ncbi:MAG: PhoH family protein [Lachnospiraceae bacterium]|nr:PhoH family protein [Lachnospiraceae bacterium]
MAETIKKIELSQNALRDVSGELDRYFRKIEKAFRVDIVSRGDSITLMGDETAVASAEKVIGELAQLSERGSHVTEQSVDYSIASALDNIDSKLIEIDNEVICRTIGGKPVKPKTLGQKKYVEAIKNNMVCFGLGPAGTGKTYLAMAMAISAFKEGEVDRIILTRPAIEAGEKLGFLPGDLQSKIDPYLRPLYDALYQIMGAESYLHNYEKGAIEVAPLAYMRGRTLDNAYIILDEAQNTTPAQMKMFLTRIGFGSKVIVTGDTTQKDLPAGQKSGLDVALKVLSGVEGIAVVELTNRDVVRHPLVQKIVEAYEKFEKKEAAAAKRRGQSK